MLRLEVRFVLTSAEHKTWLGAGYVLNFGFKSPANATFLQIF